MINFICNSSRPNVTSFPQIDRLSNKHLKERSSDVKYMYTRYLIENEDMLGANCKVHSYKNNKGEKVNGYPQKYIKQAVEFIDNNFENFSEITPRVAVKVVDTIYTSKDNLEMQSIMLDSLVK